jgi:hypothetical protein
MRPMRPFLAALLAISIITIPHALNAGHTSGSSSFNVTTTIYDTDANGVQTLMRSDDYNGTGQAGYSASLNPNVVSDVYNGVLFMELYRQSLRTLFITPNDAINNQQPQGPPPGYYATYVEMFASCYDANGNIVPLQNIVTSSGNCRLGSDFGYNGVKYKIVMSPVLPAPGPATGLATVTCNSVSGGLCVSWTIAPNLSGPNPTVSNLYYYARGGKLTFIGQYYNTFRIDVTNP